MSLQFLIGGECRSACATPFQPPPPLRTFEDGGGPSLGNLRIQEDEDNGHLEMDRVMLLCFETSISI